VALASADAPVVEAARVAVRTVTVVVGATGVTLEAEATVVGVGRFAAAAIVVVLVGKATSAFPDKSVQKLFTSVRVARRALPSTLVRYVIGRLFWMARRRGLSRFVTR
jgi:hypothetical protein